MSMPTLSVAAMVEQFELTNTNQNIQLTRIHRGGGILDNLLLRCIVLGIVETLKPARDKPRCPK